MVSFKLIRKQILYKPKVLHSVLSEAVPTTIQEALTHPLWSKAVHDEYNALLKNKTWSLTQLPSNCRAVGCKWVVKLKKNPNGSISKYKARLVAKGFHQQAGLDFLETFSPVVKPTTIRIVLTISLARGLPIRH